MDVVKGIVYLSLLGLLSFVAGRAIPKRVINEKAFPFCHFPFEKEGRIYERLKIRKWQGKLPDMSRVCKRIMAPKKMTGAATLRKTEYMIKETCIAELVHILLIIFGAACIPMCKKRLYGIVLYCLWAIGNLPFIIAQRYNRARLSRLNQRLLERQSQI